MPGMKNGSIFARALPTLPLLHTYPLYISLEHTFYTPHTRRQEGAHRKREEEHPATWHYLPHAMFHHVLFIHPEFWDSTHMDGRPVSCHCLPCLPAPYLPHPTHHATPLAQAATCPTCLYPTLCCRARIQIQSPQHVCNLGGSSSASLLHCTWWAGGAGLPVHETFFFPSPFSLTSQQNMCMQGCLSRRQGKSATCSLLIQAFCTFFFFFYYKNLTKISQGSPLHI